jgi:hypothetical protein
MPPNLRGFRQPSTASASRIISLAKPDFSHAAKRFLRWRKKNWKPKKPVRVRYWQSRKPVR